MVTVNAAGSSELLCGRHGRRFVRGAPGLGSRRTRRRRALRRRQGNWKANADLPPVRRGLEHPAPTSVLQSKGLRMDQVTQCLPESEKECKDLVSAGVENDSQDVAASCSEAATVLPPLPEAHDVAVLPPTLPGDETVAGSSLEGPDFILAGGKQSDGFSFVYDYILHAPTAWVSVSGLRFDASLAGFKVGVISEIIEEMTLLCIINVSEDGHAIQFTISPSGC